MSIRQGSRTFVDALSRKPSSAYVCRQCRQSLKLQQNTLQARNASTVGPNSRRSKRVREWRKPVVYPLYRETQLGEKITEIETPSKDQFDEEGNSVFARDWSGLKVIPSYKDIKDIPNRKEDVYMPWQKITPTNLSQSHLVSLLFQAIVECDVCGSLDKARSFTSNCERSRLLSHEHLKSVSVTNSQDGASHKISQPELDEENKLEFEEANKRAKMIEENPETFYQPSEEQQTFLRAKVNLREAETFNILKRFSFLIGQRIPDPILTTLSQPPTNTYQHLVETLYEHIKPKPQKVAEILALKTELLNQENVLVFPRKEKLRDKEDEVGRWKIIQEELKSRYLIR